MHVVSLTVKKMLATMRTPKTSVEASFLERIRGKLGNDINKLWINAEI